MSRHVLIPGGAGFIGSHLADALPAGGHRVRVLDSLEAMAERAWYDPSVEALDPVASTLDAVLGR